MPGTKLYPARWFCETAQSLRRGGRYTDSIPRFELIMRERGSSSSAAPHFRKLAYLLASEGKDVVANQ